MAQPIAAIVLDDLEHRITLTVEETASILATVPILDIGGTASIPDQSPAACFSGPMLDLWSGPQANAALTEIDDRPGHIGIAVQIRCDAVPVRQSQQARDAVCIDEVINVDLPAHIQSLHMLTDPPG